MSDDGMVTVLLCDECKKRGPFCECLDGFHEKGKVIPHSRRLHCAKCGALTRQFVKWEVSDSYSFGPLCIEHTNALPGRYTAVAVDNVEYIAKMISGSSYAVQQ